LIPASITAQNDMNQNLIRDILSNSDVFTGAIFEISSKEQEGGPLPM